MELNENSGPKSEEKGKLLLVDPNPPGRDIVPNEDLFMYVKFRAISRSRSVILKEGDTKGTGILNQEDRNNVINFISTSVKYGDDGKTILNDGMSYATTDWTQIGGLNSGQNPGGLMEGFGIKSINIKYNASLVPVVDITFIDVRGSALFDVIDQDNRKSPYSIFFKLPYPIFELSLKGYFGKTVKYCLHMTKWTSNFDGSTGNFEIKANFIGFQQAFLADINMQNVIGVVNTDEGIRKLADKSISVKLPDGTISNEPTPKYDDFLNQISRLQVDLAAIKSNNEDFQRLRSLNTTVNLLEEIQANIGKALPFDGKDGNEDFKVADQIDTDRISAGNLSKNTDFLSIRDFIVVKETKKQYFDQFARSSAKLVEEYKEYLIDKSIEISGDGILSEFIFNLDTNGNLSDIKPFIAGGGVDSKLQFRDFANNFFNDTGDENSLYGRLTDRTNFVPGDKFGDKNITSIDDFNRRYTGENKFNVDDNVLVYDFSKMRDDIQRELTDKKESRDKLKSKLIEDINKEVSKSIGFNPTIGDVFHIIMNNVQVMLEVIYDVSVKAEQKEKERFKDLQRAGVITDIPGVDGKTQDISQETNKKIYAWAGIYGLDTDGASDKLKQKWLGDENIDESNFPEIKFIEEVLDGYLQSTEELRENRQRVAQATKNNTSSNWLRINPIDYSSNPFTELSSNSMWEDLESGIPKKLIEILLVRAISLRDYSNIGNNKTALVKTFESFSKIEGATAALATIVPKYNEILSESLDKTNSFIDTVINYGVSSGIISKQNDGYIINGGSADLNNKKITSDITDTNTSFLLVGNEASAIIGTNSYLDPKVQGALSDEIKLLKPKSSEDDAEVNKGIFTYGEDNIYKHNISYLVFPDSISNKIKDKIKWSGSYRFKVENIQMLDGEVSGDAGTELSNYDHIGVDAKGVEMFNNTNETFQEAWDLNNSNQYSQALILLNTFPFLKFGEVVKRYIEEIPKYNVSKVLQLPTTFIAWVGGTLWRYSQSTDPVLSPQNGFSFGNKDEYITSVGGKKPFNTEYPDIGFDDNGKEYNFNITKLSKSTKDSFINFFIRWVDSNFINFEKYIKEYLRVGNSNNLLNTIINSQSNVVVVTPKTFKTKQPPQNLFISTNDLETYLQQFAVGYTTFSEKELKETENQSENDDGKNSTENTTNNSDLKASMYGYFKEIYDKWVGGTDDGRVFNICGGNVNENGQERQLIEYFNFIDRGWNDIGDIAAINLDSVVTLASDTNTSLYFYISKILRDSNFIFQMLPNFINFKDAAEVKKMFQPITDISDKNKSSGPAFVCIYAGGQSKSLQIGERYEYSDDGFDIFNNPPEDIGSGNKDIQKSEENYKLVAFRVAFGSENQTIFKNVSLNQEEHKTTGEYIKQLSNLVDKRSGIQRVYQGTDLYSLFSVRSYTCKVEALGCMNIQPLMYFQLDNVPFYTGAYLITSVEHSITPNHITTSFTGLRQSSFVAPVVDNATTFLNIDFDEYDEIAQKDQVTNLTTPEQINYNTDYSIQNPTGLFPFNNEDTDGQPLRGITPGTLRELGVSKVGSTDNSGTLEILSDLLNTNLPNFGITTNAQVCNFMAQCLHESDKFATAFEYWNPRDPSPIKDGVVTTAAGKVQRGYENNKNLRNGLKNGGEVDDGYRFRGRGYIQITGRENYTKLANVMYKGKKPFKNVLDKTVDNEGKVTYGADDVAETPENALVASLIWYTKIGSRSKPFDQPQNQGTVEEAVLISSIVNGSTGPANGITDRLNNFEKCAEVFGIKAQYKA
jgi:predicted chitinase